jgi:hypothetical protein
MLLQISGFHSDAIEEQVTVTYLCCWQNTSVLNKQNRTSQINSYIVTYNLYGARKNDFVYDKQKTRKTRDK